MKLLCVLDRVPCTNCVHWKSISIYFPPSTFFFFLSLGVICTLSWQHYYHKTFSFKNIPPTTIVTVCIYIIVMSVLEDTYLTVCAKQTLVLKKFAIFVMSYCGCSCMYTEWCATRLIVWLCGSIKVCVVVERVKKLQDSLVAKLVLILIKRGGGRRRWGGGEEGEENEEERGQGGQWRSGKREGEWKGRLTFTHWHSFCYSSNSPVLIKALP